MGNWSLRIYRALHTKYGNIGVVIAALCVFTALLWLLSGHFGTAGDVIMIVQTPWFPYIFTALIFVVFIWIIRKALEESHEKEQEENDRIANILSDLLASRDSNFFSEIKRDVSDINTGIEDLHRKYRYSRVLIETIDLLGQEDEIFTRISQAFESGVQVDNGLTVRPCLRLRERIERVIQSVAPELTPPSVGEHELNETHSDAEVLQGQMRKNYSDQLIIRRSWLQWIDTVKAELESRSRPER